MNYSNGRRSEPLRRWIYRICYTKPDGVQTDMNTISKNHKIKAIQPILIIATLFWMLLIFRMSAAPAVESADMSQSIGYAVGRLVVRDFDSLSPEEQQAFAEKVDYPIRKGAHFTEYAILGILLYLDFLLCTRLKSSLRFFLAFLSGTAYAGTDEFHQLFVPGRSGQLTDVMLDSSGVLCGCLLAALIVIFVQRRRVKKSSH